MEYLQGIGWSQTCLVHSDRRAKQCQCYPAAAGLHDIQLFIARAVADWSPVSVFYGYFMLRLGI